VAESKGFIDGDLVESLLDLPLDKLKEVVKGLNVTVEELVKKIESIQQALH
jgi:DNA damage-binding protein 1